MCRCAGTPIFRRRSRESGNPESLDARFRGHDGRARCDSVNFGRACQYGSAQGQCADAERGKKPDADAGGSGHAHGGAPAPLLASDRGGERIREKSREAGAPYGRGSRALQGSLRDLRADRAPLQAPLGGPRLRLCRAPRPAPLLPDWEPFSWKNRFVQIVFAQVPCNWLQAQENSIDPVHFEWMHENWNARLKGRTGPLASAHLKLDRKSTRLN